MGKKTVYMLIASAAVGLAVIAAYTLNYINSREPAFAEAAPPKLFPEMTETGFLEGGASVSRRKMEFGDGGEFSIFRVRLTESAEYTYEIPLSGADAKIRWQNYDETPYKWEFTDGLNVPRATLFIETSEESMIVSIPALYYEGGRHKTIECLPELERAAAIEQTDGGYVIRMGFEPFAGTYGEFWYYKGSGALFEPGGGDEALWLRQDLHKNRRFCYDGYYYRTYENYVPYSENGFFRNPANYTGAQIMETAGGRNPGRAMTKICLLNQNGRGYWETGPKSKWLSSDYGIDYDFYDTRFSTDFARSLVLGYTRFGDAEFLEGALKYADFLMSYADEYGYTGGSIGGGVLLPDYWGETMETRPHVSLNHQLSEINFLLELHLANGGVKHRQYARKLLLGIENTKDEWLMEDGNLNYALMSDNTEAKLADYPYLTYNDLFDTKELLASFGEESAAVNELMESKKKWMDANGVTGYYGGN